jgi:Na+/H+ antiporter NhaD/arsenite permease-like protein
MGYLVFFIGLFLLSSALNVVGIADILSTNLSALASHQGFFHIFMLWITAILTAIFGAVSTVAVLIPIIRTITMDYGTPLDIWWAISIGASFGGSITITGDATNMVGFGMNDGEVYEGKSNVLRVSQILFTSGINRSRWRNYI